MEEVNEFLSNPDQAAAFASGLVALAGSAYVAYKNDFGATDKTDVELETYLDETETGITSPISSWRAWEYSNELDSRQEETERLADPEYEEDSSRLIRYADD